MDESVLALLETFVEIERELGRQVFEDAVERARLAVAAEVMVEAERRSLRTRRERAHSAQHDGIIVAFPGAQRRGSDGDVV